MKRMYKNLSFQVLIAIVPGITTGLLFQSFAGIAKLISIAFLNLIIMLIAPVIFLTVVTGIVKTGGMTKNKCSPFFVCCLCFFLMFGHPVLAQPTSTSSSGIAEWYNKKQWLRGISEQPHPSIDQREFSKQYAANKTLWDKAFAFFKNNNLDTLAAGHYTIEGEEVFADITETPSTPFEEAKWHSHHKYCDIQYVIKGKERVGVAPIAGAPVITPFKDPGDSQFYDQHMKGKYYDAIPGSFFIFFPSDVHRPFIKVEGTGTVKRIRFKVRST